MRGAFQYEGCALFEGSGALPNDSPRIITIRGNRIEGHDLTLPELALSEGHYGVPINVQ